MQQAAANPKEYYPETNTGYSGQTNTGYSGQTNSQNSGQRIRSASGLRGRQRRRTVGRLIKILQRQRQETKTSSEENSDTSTNSQNSGQEEEDPVEEEKLQLSQGFERQRQRQRERLEDPTSKSHSVAVTAKATCAAFLLILAVMSIYVFCAVKIKKNLKKMDGEDAASRGEKSDREQEKKNELKQKLESLLKMVSGTASVIDTVLEHSGLGNVLNSQQIMLVKNLGNIVASRLQRANDEAEVIAAVNEAAKAGAFQLNRKFAEHLKRDESKKLRQSMDQMADSCSLLVQSEFRETAFSKEFRAYVDRCDPKTFQPSKASCRELTALRWVQE